MRYDQQVERDTGQKQTLNREVLELDEAEINAVIDCAVDALDVEQDCCGTAEIKKKFVLFDISGVRRHQVLGRFQSAGRVHVWPQEFVQLVNKCDWRDYFWI